MKRKTVEIKLFLSQKPQTKAFIPCLVRKIALIKHFSDLLNGFTRFKKKCIIENQAFWTGNIPRVPFAFGIFQELTGKNS
jgi:hypothetical protein